jgi:hypothetical protein
MRALTIALALAAIASLVPADRARAGGRCSGFRPTISGTPGGDLIIGTEDADVIKGGRGDDRIEGRGLHDYICAGSGEDVIEGEEGNDWIRAGDGDDSVFGGDGGDYLVGQGGVDTIDGGLGVGTDTCLAEALAACEADVAVSLVSPFFGPTLTGGDQQVYSWRWSIRNNGPSQAISTYAVVDLPAAAEFVSQPGSRCVEGPIDELTCAGGRIDVHGSVPFDLAFRVPDCPPAGGEMAIFTATADDLYTNPLSGSSGSGKAYASARIVPAPSCPQ